jgi:hypothetical protein
MIGGAEFTDSVVFRHAHHLSRHGGYRFSAIGLGESGGAAGGRSVGREFDQAFERCDRFPHWKQRPGGAAATLRLAGDFVFAPDVPPLAATLKGRVEERLRWGYAARNLARLWRGYDLYHWHCFDPQRLGAVRLLPLESKLLVSLWGSDLYRTSGMPSYRRQLDACRRATALTVGSLEMRETFLAKFGWEWESKVRVVNYGAELATVRAARPLRDRFLRDYGIPSDRVVVCLGNSGSRANQHLKALAALAGLSPQALARLLIVIPMTYGVSPPYLAEVRRAADAHPATVRILDRFLPDDENAALRWSTDIMVHLPVSDQFSASMCESIYAGSVLVTGAWLPYSRLRLSGIPYHELGDVSELRGRIEAILNQLPSERRRAAEAAPKIWNLMAWEEVTPRWLELYNDLLDKGGSGGMTCRQ